MENKALIFKKENFCNSVIFTVSLDSSSKTSNVAKHKQQCTLAQYAYM